MDSDVSRRIDRSDNAARREKLQSPDIIQRTKSVRFPLPSGVHLAYCKVAAGASTSIVCYLDTDTTGPEITVECTVSPPANLDGALPLLADGSELKVAKIGNTWKCIAHFIKSRECS